MARLSRTIVGLGVLATIGYVLRTQLVHLLTRTTGTWVGTPDS
jgi:hypothetical protein